MQQPSAQEIEREVAALRDIRRRSSQQGPGSIPLDPDLPPNGPASTSGGGYWDDYSASPRPAELDSPGSGEGSEDGSDDPSHLFWVPAHLHPEIAPAEFRAFLKEHTNAAPGDGVPLARSMSGSSGLGRKRSMLSKQYTPRAGDGIEDEKVVTVKRNRSSIYSTAGPQLTISDLQKLEQLAEEAAKSDDPSKLRSVLRRSLSLNVAPSFIDQMDGVPEEDDADAPIIVPRPGQILRRTARTKIRKAGLPGDGGGHRFASTRRGVKAAKPDVIMPGDESQESESARTSVEKPRASEERPLSYADEAFILDAYGDRRDSVASNPSSTEEDDLTSAASHSSAPTTVHQSSSHGSAGPRPISPPVESPVSPPRGQTVRRVSPPPSQQSDYHQPQPVQSQSPVLHHPAPQRHLEVPHQGMNNRGPSPGSEMPGPRPAQATSPDPFRRSPSAPPQSTGSSGSFNLPSPSVSPAPSVRSNKSNKEREKKGLLKGMWGGEKKKEKESKDKGGEGGFLSSIFGGGKKKHEEEPRGLLAGAGPAAAAALLGASKAKHQPSPPSPGPNNYSRYPIHVERAVYRLSHIKLANPRRPLYEQVLISNLMFWYLGVINKVTPPAGGAKEGANGSEAEVKSDEEKEKAERERLEKERLEREEKERAEKERLEKEREREQREKEKEKEREGKKRGTLVKNIPPGSGPGGGRRAEMPVRGPQYDVQHRQMEQEGGYHHPPGGRPPMGRAPGPPEGAFGMDGRGPPPRHHTMGGPPPHHHGQPPFPPGPPHPQQFSPGGGPQATNYMQFAPSLPPGAMPPPSGSPEPWMGSSAASRDSPYAAAAPMNGPSRSMSPPSSRGPPPNGPNSPPGGGARLVQRSVSANAGGPPPPPPQMMGPGPGRPPMQQRGPPPPGPPNGAGSWGPPIPQQRRGPSPQPPPAGARRPRTAESDEQRSMEWQQPQRGGPIVR